VSAKHWWDADHPPRVFAEALLAMAPDKARQRAFYETHVPEHLRGIVLEHVQTAMALGKSNEEG
jgi:hypothetical protein